MSIAAVDLFCGAGGLTHGLVKAGIEVRAGYDLDPASQYPYEVNNKVPFVLADVNRLRADELQEQLHGADWTCLVGCAPCQPFSTYRQAYEAREDARWGLVGRFGKLINDVLPDLVSMENVPSLVKHEIFIRFVKRLERAGYHVWHEVVQSADYGVPQSRRRLILLASLHDAISLIPPTHKTHKTVRDAISGIEPIRAGETSDRDPMHKCSKLSPLNQRRIRASKPGGSWRDWPKELVAPCHTRGEGHKYGAVYGRMEWDSPAPTITTECFGFGSGRFGHPEQDRGLSLREAAILQSFPPRYKFVRHGDPVSMKSAGRLIGNAVPVRLGLVVGRSLVRHVSQFA